MWLEDHDLYCDHHQEESQAHQEPFILDGSTCNYVFYTKGCAKGALTSVTHREQLSRLYAATMLTGLKLHLLDRFMI